MMKSIHKLRLKPHKAFTLVELIMTIVVVGIVAIPLSLLLTQHTQSVFQSQDYTMALDLARLEMEKVNNMNSYNPIANASFPNYAGYNYDITRTVTFVNGTDVTPEGLRQIRVDARKAGSATILETLVTYLARKVNYGL